MSVATATCEFAKCHFNSQVLLCRQCHCHVCVTMWSPYQSEQAISDNTAISAYMCIHSHGTDDINNDNDDHFCSASS